MPPRFLLLCLLLAGWLVTPPPELSAQTSDFQAKAEQAAEEEAYASALEACLYGYPRAELWSRIQNETRRVTEDQVIFGDPHAVERQRRHFERGGATGVGTLTTDWEAYRERPATGCQGAAKDKNTCPAESLSSLLCRSFLLSNQEVSIQKFVNQFLTLRELLFRRELSGNGL